jgi:hypothetical protein
MVYIYRGYHNGQEWYGYKAEKQKQPDQMFVSGWCTIHSSDYQCNRCVNQQAVDKGDAQDEYDVR